MASDELDNELRVQQGFSPLRSPTMPDTLSHRLRWLVHLLHSGRVNNWQSRTFCFVCSRRRLMEWMREPHDA
jgi:hypothetical protein